jgi:hypothetical protein
VAWYTAFIEVAAGVKVPVPLGVDQIPVVGTEPTKVALALLAQIVWSAPALTKLPAAIVRTIWSVTVLQVPFPVLVSVIVTVPAVISAALGAYVTLSVVLLGMNVPDPVLVHIPTLATDITPLIETFGLAEQVVLSGPALAVGASEIVTIIWSVAATQLPLPVVVNVRVTVPAVVSASLGV